MSLIEEIQSNLYTKTNKINTAIIRQDWFKKSNLYADIMKETSFLDNDVCFAARIFCIVNNIKSMPACPVTGKSVKWLPTKHRFAIAAGRSNASKIKKIDNAKLSQSLKASKALIKSNFYSLYKTNKFNIVSREKCTDFIKSRLEHTDHGRKHNFVDTSILKKYHDECCSIILHTQHPLLDDNDINWSERFFLLYNNDVPKLCNYDPTQKAKFCNFLAGYNNNSSAQARNKNTLKIIKQSIEYQNFSILNDINSHQQEYQLRCNVCNSILQRRLTNARWKDIFCAKCNNVTVGSSRAEAEISAFLQNDCNMQVERLYDLPPSGIEIDIFLPQKNVGIEHHGLLWHSFGSCFPDNADVESVNKFKHRNKRDICMSNNVQLLQIFENEWIDKRNIVESMMRSKLGILQNKIYARNCTIQCITAKQKSIFLNNNHIQGNDNSQIAIALIHEGDIVAAMTFGNRKITANKTFELIRFCCKTNTSVIGGASKLLKYFTKKHNVSCITTYADLRFCFDGSFYKNLGFKHIRTTPPAYWYTDTKTVMHRSNFQKHKLVKQGDDLSLTEWEIMKERGWRRIWDCGHMVFEYKYS